MFIEGECYVVNWRPTTAAPNNWTEDPGLYFQNDSGLPFSVGPVTIVEGFEGYNAENPGNFLHPRLRFCEQPCEYCFEDTTNIDQWCLQVVNEDASGNVWMKGLAALSKSDIRTAVGTYIPGSAGLSLSGDEGDFGVPFNLNISEGSLFYTSPTSPGGPDNPQSDFPEFWWEAPAFQGGNGVWVNISPGGFGGTVTVFQCGETPPESAEGEFGEYQVGYDKDQEAIEKEKKKRKRKMERKRKRKSRRNLR